MGQRRLRYADLVARNIVRNRVTLSNWIKNNGFPPGQLTGPNSRTWGDDEIDEYIASRPTEPKPTPQPKRRPGRPRKSEAIDPNTALKETPARPSEPGDVRVCDPLTAKQRDRDNE